MMRKKYSLSHDRNENCVKDGCVENQLPVPILNIANILTSVRLLAVPVFIFCYIRAYYHGVYYQSWICLLIFLLAALTDRLDGYYARKYRMYTNLGAFLDPLADKFLVCAAAVCLSISGRLAWWFTAVIIAREVSVTFLRVNLVSDQGVLPAQKVGKWKTVFQIVTLGWFLFPPMHDSFVWSYIGNCFMVITTAITIYSALFYLKQWFSKV